ncbi:MAG TPA: CbiX/SirB N-terminal domain-containing protein [Myxococcota bacterium]|nr:CbiX/SirB N-terminal domain-containing protein [Myxococcota bacterium]
MSERSAGWPALLIVDHGTRAAHANLHLEELARSVAKERPGWLVQHAHMELAEPDFGTGIELLVERGAREILVHLHFLGAGYHVRESIPSLIAEARSRHPRVPIETTEPLGRDPRLVDIVVGRMDLQSRSARQSSKE